MVSFTDFTPEKKAKFIAELRKQPNVSRACRLARVSRPTAYAHRDPDDSRYDADFETEWADALHEGVERMEEEAYRRAFKGVDKPVFQQGRQVGTIREYSDALTIFLLKAHAPDKYRDHVVHEGPDGGPIPIGIVKMDIDEL